MLRPNRILASAGALIFGQMGLAAADASAREIRLPLSVEPPIIRGALVREIFTDPKERAVFWGAPGECSFFYLQDPQVEGGAGRLRVVAKGEARLGADLGSSCLSPIEWTGYLELFERPRLDGWKLRFDVVDSNLLDENRQKLRLLGQLWDRIKESVQPRFGAVTIDLGGPFRALREFLSAIAAQPTAEEAERAIASLRPVSVNATPNGIVVEAALDVADGPAASAPLATEAPLSEAEIAAFTERAKQWDVFLTFVVKTLGARALGPPVRQALLETLLDARYQLADALAAPTRQSDPVRAFFLKSWGRLRPVAGEIARGLSGAEAVQILTFVAAGDALQVLDQAGPTFGLEVSANGLRRMARMIAPSAPGDPLEPGPDVDPALRDLLGFGAPLSAADEIVPAPTTLERRGWRSPLALFFGGWGGGTARAATEADRSQDWTGWVAEDESDLRGYLNRVGTLLDRIGARVTSRDRLKPGYAELFRKLLPATAWQESCWRQFRRRDDKVTYLRSRRGSVGMLQVNERVWRGFYEVDKLRWKVAYNVQAGSEVLLHYLEMVDDRSLSAGQTARAVYAGYNGGPSELRSYSRGKGRGAVGRLVDRLFGPKFEAVANARSEVATCLTGEPLEG